MSSIEHKAHKSALDYFVIIPIVSAAFFSFLYLNAKSFWLDEAWSISLINAAWPQLWEILSQREANMSLYYLLLKIWVMLFGDSELAVRSLSALFAIAGVAVTYVIGARLFNARTGMIAGIVLSVNSFFIHYAQEARGYSLTLLLCTLSVFLFIKIIEKQEHRYYIAHGLINAMVLYSHFFGLFVLIAQLISVIFLPFKTIIWKRILASTFLTIFLAFPLGLFFLTVNIDPIGWIAKPSLVDLYNVFFHLTGNGGKFLLLWYVIPCFIILIFFCYSLYHLKRNQLVWKYALLLCWLFVPIVGIYLVSLVKPSFVYRYMLPSVPALVLLAGVGFTAMRPRILSLAATSVLILFSLHGVFSIYYPDKKEDWRSATSFIVEKTKPGDAILFFSKIVQIPFEYYYNKMNHGTDNLVSVYPFAFGTPIEVHMLTKKSNPTESMLESLADKYDRLWVVLSHDHFNPLRRDSIIKIIEKKYVNLATLSFEGVSVKLYKVSA